VVAVVVVLIWLAVKKSVMVVQAVAVAPTMLQEALQVELARLVRAITAVKETIITAEMAAVVVVLVV